MTDGESRDPAPWVWPGQNGGLPYARCGNYEIHEAHTFPVVGCREDQCTGWTVHEQLTRTVITSVRQYLRDNYGPLDPKPEGLRLELHPQALRSLIYITGIWGDILPRSFGIPVKVNTDLPDTGWRLVIVTEEVLLEGKAADAPR